MTPCATLWTVVSKISAGARNAILPDLQIQIVKRSDQIKSFDVLPKRWDRRTDVGVAQPLSQTRQDWDNLNRTALAFLRSP
jgi:hypothetical protein